MDSSLLILFAARQVNDWTYFFGDVVGDGTGDGVPGTGVGVAEGSTLAEGSGVGVTSGSASPLATSNSW